MKFVTPMSCQRFDPDAPKHIVFPCYVQPKLDGVRCVTDGRRFWSRAGHLFPEENVAHLQATKLWPGVVDDELVDGELIIPGLKLNEIVSVVKRRNHPDRAQLEFHVFDVTAPLFFSQRRNIVLSLFTSPATRRLVPSSWFMVQTIHVADRNMLDKMHRQFRYNGGEGSIIRNAKGIYVSKRSKDIQKWKPTQDAEFEIVEVLEAQGKDQGTPVFVCRTAAGNTFRVRPMGDTASRTRLWRHRKRLVGKFLTVEYQELTTGARSVPREPRGKTIRDYE